MKGNDLFQLVFYFFVLILFVIPLGVYIGRIYSGKLFTGILSQRIENLVFKISGIKRQQTMDWKEYSISLLGFNFVGFLLLFLILYFQNYLPLNPQALSGLSWHLAFNTAISFVTNTNWQAYSGEASLSYFSQMFGLGVQNFLSAGTGMAVVSVFARAIIIKNGREIGNFYVDLVRGVLWILLPLSVLVAIFLMSEGVVQNFNSYIIIKKNLAGIEQVLPLGPAASQIAIKQLGTNGGGFFGVNSSHPFENPTPGTNFIQMFCILIIPASFPFAYGEMLGKRKQGTTIFFTMFFLLVIGLVIMLYSEFEKNSAIFNLPFLEGKETRLGILNSVIWGSVTTAASNGSVNAMHDSFSPLSGMVAIFQILAGEVIFGGVGAGMYGILLFVVLTVFLSGLMVGRSPEYLGKKIEKTEVKFALFGVLIPSVAILLGVSISSVTQAGLSARTNFGPHGFSEILYAFTSAGGNNGSAFAGLGVDSEYYNIMLGMTMLVGRFGVIFPFLAIAGSLAGKNIAPVSSGTFRTDSLLFFFLLTFVIIIIGALTFLPHLVLGPIVEHFLMKNGKLF